MESLNITTKIEVYSIEECSEERKTLIERAKNAAMTAYAPYSGYHVGAAALLSDGTIVEGSNQENAAYPSGLCAERTALFYANAKYPNLSVKAIAIAAYNKGDYTMDVCTPCGSCRQVITEVENRYDTKVEIIMYGQKHVYVVDSIRALLPLCFEKTAMD